jgi:hypothetical protein
VIPFVGKAIEGLSADEWQVRRAALRCLSSLATASGNTVEVQRSLISISGKVLDIFRELKHDTTKPVREEATMVVKQYEALYRRYQREEQEEEEDEGREGETDSEDNYSEVSYEDESSLRGRRESEDRRGEEDVLLTRGRTRDKNDRELLPLPSHSTPASQGGDPRPFSPSPVSSPSRSPSPSPSGFKPGTPSSFVFSPASTTTSRSLSSSTSSSGSLQHPTDTLGTGEEVAELKSQMATLVKVGFFSSLSLVPSLTHHPTATNPDDANAYRLHKYLQQRHDRHRQTTSATGTSGGSSNEESRWLRNIANERRERKRKRKRGCGFYVHSSITSSSASPSSSGAGKSFRNSLICCLIAGSSGLLSFTSLSNN